MKSDLEIIAHHFDNDILIYPISDVHLGASEHMEGAWSWFTNYILSKPDAYVILNGDLINNATRSSVSNIFEETIRPRDQKRLITQHLEPLRDRILCATTGNHERRSVKDADDDPTYDIMCKLDLENVYRPNIAFLRLTFGRRYESDGCKRNKVSYTFGVTHGAGGGIYTGATVNRNERFMNVIEGLDCLVVGHTHKGTVSKPQKLVVDSRSDKVLTRETTVISSVSWMSYGGYAAQKMLLPAISGKPQEISLNSKTKKLSVIW